MSDYIQFEIQSEIIKRLPVKSLIQLRSVSKQWNSFIDSSRFIKNYHINHTSPQHHLLVSYKLGTVQTYTSIVANNTFPQLKSPLTAPESLSLLRNTSTLNSVNGLLCFCGFYGDIGSRTEMVVIWTPSVRKSVGVVIPYPKAGYNVFGFGVCPDTSDPKLVKINVIKIRNVWQVEVFTLSTRVWKSVYTDVPFKSCHFYAQVFVNGVIYFSACHMDHGFKTNIVISFDFKREKFGEVCLPEILVRAPQLDMTKVHDLLGLLEYYSDGCMLACRVWSRKDGANKPFTKIYTFKLGGRWSYPKVLGFRNNGEAVMEVRNENNPDKSGIEVYEPLSGNTIGVGINRKRRTFFAMSYMETLLLLDESASIIR